MASCVAKGGTLARKTLPPELQRALAKVTDIGALPEVTARIVQTVEDPRATARDMHAIVRADPALASKVLRVVNSAFYGLPAQVASLERAILLLGLSAVKNIALAASLARLFSVTAVTEQFTARDLWRHCVAVAVCARLLASAGKIIHAEEAFVAGLVHDVGLIVVQQLFLDQLKAISAQCHTVAQDFCKLERAVIGADHQAFGAVLAAKWRFPASLQQAIAYHHEPLALPPEDRKTAALVYAADTLCGRDRYGYWFTTQGQELTEEILQPVAIGPELLERVAAELPARVEEAERILAE
jgi:putative nucleotidyltransferase with HDIG domain